MRSEAIQSPFGNANAQSLEIMSDRKCLKPDRRNQKKPSENLKEDIYIKIPRGIEQTGRTDVSEYAKLNKAIYGLAQASREFYRTISTYLLQVLNCSRCITEPCLFRYQKDLLLAVYVDDLLLVGPKHLCTKFEGKIKEKFRIRINKQVCEYIGSELIIKKDEKFWAI